VDGLAAMLGHRRARRILDVHDAPGHGRHGRSTEWIEGWLCRRLRFSVVVHSSSVRDEVALRWRLKPADIELVPLGIDTGRFPVATDRVQRWRADRGITPERRVILYVSRLVASKNIDLYLDVAARLRGQASDALFVLVATGPGVDELRRRISELDLDESVLVLGPQSLDDLAAAYATSAVFVSTSDYEGFGLAVAEAMAAGCPVVATRVGGVRDLVEDGVSGWLVDPGNGAALADRVLQLLGDERQRAQMASVAAERARRHFAIDLMVTGYSETYLRIRGRRVAILKSPDYESFRRQRDDGGLPYRIDYLSRYGYTPSFSDVRYRRPWKEPLLRAAVDKVEALGVPALQTLTMAPRLVRSDAVLAMFESEGHLLALARALRLPLSRRPPMVVISCWLSSVLPTVGQTRLAWYRRMYQTVDGIVVFSTNQLEPLARMLGVDAHLVRYVPFGVDSDWFAPRSAGTDDGFVLVVGRDRGRDWPTLLAAARTTGLPTKIACRPSDIAGLAVPENVDLLGYVDVESYRSLLHRARLSVVATSDVPYPSGQTVALESMAAAKATVATRTPSLVDYLDDGVNALTVPVGDPQALANAITEAFEDAALRDRLGSGARAAVEQSFNARAMWARVATILDEVSTR
jgi:glycosyltransferase involved in cell wall biosynthesis